MREKHITSHLSSPLRGRKGKTGTVYFFRQQRPLRHSLLKLFTIRQITEQLQQGIQTWMALGALKGQKQ